MEKFTLELKIDVPPEARDAFVDQLKMFARTMLTMATLATQGRRKPRVVLSADDFFTSEHEISVMEDELSEDVRTHDAP
jgi:hypothetical protein